MGKTTQRVAIVALLLLAVVGTAHAAEAPGPDISFFDLILEKFQGASKGWSKVITGFATYLFWCLATISMVITFGFMALRKADVGEFFAEFVRFTIFTGFFWWLLDHGPLMATALIYSLAEIAAKAGGITVDANTTGLAPSGVVKLGFKIFEKIIDNMSFWPSEVAPSLVGALMGVGILIMLCLIGINMLLLTISAWFLAYAGIFFLGFGGSRWTSDIAINYFKTTLGLAAQIMAMILIIAIGKTFIDQYYATVEAGVTGSNLKALGALFVAVLVLMALSGKIPPLLAGIITGAAAGGGGIGNSVGAGTLAAAAGMAAAGATMGASAAASLASQAGGGSQALMAAFKSAQSNVGGGTDIASKLGSALGGSSSSGSSSGASSSGGTPLGSAMGLSGGSSTSSGGASAAGSSGSSGSSGSTEAGSGDSGGGSSSGASGDQEQQTAAAEGAEGGSGNQEAQGEGSGQSKAATAGRIALDMAAQLAGGVGRAAAGRAGQMADSAKERMANTVGGKLAQEISNPGAKAQARQDDKDIAKADGMKAAAERSERAAEAREYLAGNQTPEFTGNSVSGTDPDDEVAAFRNRSQNS